MLKSSKTMVWITVVLLCLIGGMAVYGAPCGDVNNDNQVTIIDALMIAQKYVGLNPPGFQSASADVSGDNAVTIIDALMVAQYYVGLINTFPGCGTTQTPTPPPTSATFPYSPNTYPYGINSVATNQQTENAYVQSEYNSWKSSYVTSSGAGGNLRVRRPQDSNDSVSEGIAYGMLFSLYMDDQATMSGLWNYAKAHFDSRGMMHWQIDSNGNVIGQNAASDADQDMALALIFAEKKWPGKNYGNDARNLINAMYQHEVEPGTYVFKPGDSWGGSSVTNISYYFPAAYKIFAQYTNNSGWNNVVDKCYQVIAAVQSARNTPLVPDWCTASGGSASSVTWDQWKDEYYYDAVRFPWRISVDYLWFGDSRAFGDANDATAFFAAKGARNIVNGYYLNGNAFGSFHDPAFVAMAGAGSMASSNQAFASQMYQEVKATKNNQYYQDCLRMFALLQMTGNFPNILNL